MTVLGSAATPLVSAVVPIFNGERFLREALDSIVAQTYPNCEVIAVDDGSTDGSGAIVRSYPHVRSFRQENRGVASARNRALAECRGEYVAFLDQDDRWAPRKLELQVAALEDEPDAGFAIARMRVLIAPGVAPPRFHLERQLREDTLAFIPGVLMARRRLFAADQVGAFDESFVNGSDTDWVLRAKDLGIRFLRLNETLLVKRVHEANASHRIQVNRDETFLAIWRSIQRQRSERRRPS